MARFNSPVQGTPELLILNVSYYTRAHCLRLIGPALSGYLKKAFLVFDHAADEGAL